ncbi:MAG: chemotaxis protein CheW [Candidatus Lokiarchaeota archaeon]|nr:chemotaxis protein CheW [Candidatus Lokiarchaeota archaeon]MBD3199413.1 chemotaxis protein CheW [Candidatus Lokiarchaeota archaeon]
MMQNEEYYSEMDQISVIIFQVGWEEFSIDLLDVKEIIKTGQIRRLPKSLDFIEGIYNYRGDIIHIINLKRKLNLNDYKIYRNDGTTNNINDDDDDSKNFIIIVNINDNNIGFYVDRIIKVERVNQKQLIGLSPILQTGISDVEYIKGIVKFKDRPRIFIDLRKILSEVEQISIQQNQNSLI